MTLMLLVGFFEVGATAGSSTRRGKPLPLPLTVASTKSLHRSLSVNLKKKASNELVVKKTYPMGMAGPVYGKRVSTSGSRKADTEDANNSAIDEDFIA